MQYDAQIPYRVSRFGGLATWDDPTQIPNGLAIICQNSRFSPEGVSTRYGTVTTMLGTDPLSGDAVGFDTLNTLGASQNQITLVYGANGKLYVESPPGSGTLVPVFVPFLLPANSYMQDALANNQMYMSFSDLKSSSIPPFFYDGRTNNFDTIGQNPIAAPWKQGTYYKVGDLFRSIDGRWWRNTSGSSLPATANVPSVPDENGFFSSALASGIVVNISWQNGVTTALIQPISDNSLFRVGEGITISGVPTTFYNGDFVITAVSGNTLQWNQPAPPPAVSGSIVTVTWVRNGSTTSGTTTAVLNSSAAAAAFNVGEVISVSGVADAFFNGTFTITATSPSNSSIQWEQNEPPPAGNVSVPIASVEVVAATGAPITSVSLFSAGLYVDSGPSQIVVSGGGGNGAVIGFSVRVTPPTQSDPHLRLSIDQLFIINPGSGYTSAPTLTFVGGGPQPAAAFAHIGVPQVPQGFLRVTLQQQNPFPVGTIVSFSGLVNATFLNGTSLTIAQLTSGTQFTAPYVRQNYGPAVDFGSVTGFAQQSSGQSRGGTVALAINSVDPASGGTIVGQSTSLVWNPATATDDNGGIWEEWTPNVSNQLLAPTQLVATRNQGQGSLPGGKDIYVKTTFVIPQTGETARTLPVILSGSVANDQILLRTPRLPRWMAEINIQEQRFDPFFLNVYVAAVNAGATAPADSAYFQYEILQSVGSDSIVINTVPNSDIQAYPLGAYISLRTPNAPQAFIGEAGRRNIIVTRRDKNGSLAPVDPDSAIPIDFQGAISANVVGPSDPLRKMNGQVTFWVDDISKFAVGQVIIASNIADFTFDGTYTIISLGPAPPSYQSPAGFIVAQGSVFSSATTTPGGALRLATPPPAPIAFLPPGGANDMQDVLGLTLIGTSKAGPFSYIVESNPQKIVRTMITSLISDGTAATVNVDDSAGLEAGQTAFVSGFTGNLSFLNGIVQIGSVSGSTVSYTQGGLAANVSAPSGIILTVMNVLPTTAPAAVQTITRIIRDAAGNVTASFSDIGGYDPGHVIQVAAVNDGTFNGFFQITSTQLNDDGFSGTLGWTQIGQVAAGSSGGTISSIPDFVLNFQDEDLKGAISGETDITDQLTAIPPPPCIDIFYSESLRRFVYTRGNDTAHYFSNTDDPANIQSPDGILGVNSSNGKRTIALREMLNGEIISLKEDGGYAIEPNDVAPNQWTPARRWRKHAPVGPRAIGLGPDWMMIFSAKTGPWRYYQGELVWVGKELTGTWKRVNWAAKKEIWIEVDEDQQKTYIGLPLDGSATCNYRAVVDYFDGWGDPLIETLNGDMVPNRNSRRWSLEPFAARYGKIVDRQLATSVNTQVDDKQMLFGMGGNSPLRVRMEVPDMYNDDGAGIDWQYQPAFAEDKKLAICNWLGISGRAVGKGGMIFTAVPLQDKSVPLQKASRSLVLRVSDDGFTLPSPYQGGERVQTDLFTYLVSNAAVPDAWGELQELFIWYKPEYDARKNENLIEGEVVITPAIT